MNIRVKQTCITNKASLNSVFVLSNPSLRFLYFRNPCCGKETKNLTQFFQVPYVCQQNKKNLNVIVKKGRQRKNSMVEIVFWAELR